MSVLNFAVAVPFAVVGVGSSGFFSGTATSGSSGSLQVFSALGSIVAGTITFPFVSALIALTYVDRRMRTEGLDIELMRSSGYGQPTT